MSYRNEPTKNSSGAKARFFGFLVALATVAFFGFTQQAKASFYPPETIPFYAGGVIHNYYICFGPEIWSNQCRYYSDISNIVSNGTGNLSFDYTDRYTMVEAFGGHWSYLDSASGNESFGLSPSAYNTFNVGTNIPGAFPNTDCTSYNYGDWSECSSDGFQSRVLISGNPSGCDIVYPSVITSQSCIPSPNSEQSLWTSFDYPKMLGPIFHADYKMTDLTTTVPMRVKLHISNLDSGVASHIQSIVVRKTSSDYSTINTANPFLETYIINTRDSNDEITFQPDLILGETYYYTYALVYDDDFMTANPSVTSAIIERHDFSITGLSPDDVNYDLGQSPVLPPVDSNGNSTGSTGSIVGDLIQTQLNSSWASIHSQFADFFTLYQIIQDAPTSASSSALYTGTVGLGSHTGMLVWDPFHELSIPSVVPTMVSFVAYLGLGWFLIRNAHRFFE